MLLIFLRGEININTLKLTKEIINKYDLRAKKAFGQNFLIDDFVLESIANISEIDDKTLVIEIGPGLGNLTYYLQKSSLMLIELDTRMLEILNYRFKDNKNITIINADVLKINIDEEIDKLEKKNNVKYDVVKVVANLPYYITSPIIFKLLEESKRITEIVAMVQEEVANRIVANTKSKDYGILTVMVNYYAKATKEIIVPNSSFIPSPNVTSAVVKIVKEEKYKEIDDKIFKELVHKAFANRRKKLLNSLVMNKFMNLEKDEINNLLKICNISDNARAEELDIEKYIELTKLVMSK